MGLITLNFPIFPHSLLHAQDGGFDRFDSSPDFDSAPPPPPPMEEGGGFEPPPPMDSSSNSFDDGGDFDDFDGGARTGGNSPSSGGSTSAGNAKGSEGKIFGRNKETSLPKKDSKYVNLNPETAYGPEIVESFDFPDADILEITKHMQKLTGINLILDKDVKGKVSISAPTPITVGDAWKAYLTALSMAGYSLVKSGAFYRIVPMRDIRFTPTKIYMGDFTPDTDNYVLKIIPLKYVNATEIERTLRQFATRQGRVFAIQQTNTVVIGDAGTNITRLEKLVKFVDVPGFEETLQIVKVKYTSAQEIAKLLESIIRDKNASGSSRTARIRSSGASGGGTGPSISRLIAEPRTNSIIAMANAEGTKQLKELILRLDVKNASKGSGRIHVYYLQHGDAEGLSKTLTALISNAQQQQQSQRNNFNGDGGGGPRFIGQVTQPETIFSEEVKVTSDKTTNSIVVTASATDWLTVKDVISKLDIPRLQVYVEGLIMETRVRNGSTFGFNYVGATGTGALSKAGFTTTGPPQFADLLSNNAFNLSGIFAGFGLGKKVDIQVPGTNGTTSYQVNTVNGLVKALAEATNSNILATPQILVTDNTEGVFEAGETIPTRQISSTGTGIQTTGAGPTQNIKMSLKITPQINKVTRFIKLKIDQRVEDIAGTADTNNGIGAPTTVRTAVTEVIVRDQDTVAMGGLMRDKDSVGENKIPLLGDVPVLGWLFKMKSKTKEKTNLIFFLTPKIIDPYEKAAAANTKEVISKRVKSLKGSIEDKDIYSDALSELADKVDQQSKGPLYDTLLNKDIDTSGPISKDQMQNVDYSKLNEDDLKSMSPAPAAPASKDQNLPPAGTKQ